MLNYIFHIIIPNHYLLYTSRNTIEEGTFISIGNLHMYHAGKILYSYFLFSHIFTFYLDFYGRRHNIVPVCACGMSLVDMHLYVFMCTCICVYTINRKYHDMKKNHQTRGHKWRQRWNYGNSRGFCVCVGVGICLGMRICLRMRGCMYIHISWHLGAISVLMKPVHFDVGV